MENDVLDDLNGLFYQATNERSHHYVARTVGRAIEEIEKLRAQTMLTKNGQISCDFCGKFIAVAELIEQKATHSLLTPDSELTKEEYESYHHACLSAHLKKLRGQERAPGTDQRTGEYSTAQMLLDEMSGGDTSQPLFD